MSDKTNSLTIGGLARAANVHVETIRYYQRRGLIPEPQRPPGRIRRYGAADIDRLMFVKMAQQLGFSLDEVDDLLQLEDGTHCREASDLAEHKLRDVREKIRRLEKIDKGLSELVDQCRAQQGDIDCPLITALASFGVNSLNRPSASSSDKDSSNRVKSVPVIRGQALQ